MPEVRDYEEQDPEQKECCFRFYYRLKTGRQTMRNRRKGEHQKEHA